MIDEKFIILKPRRLTSPLPGVLTALATPWLAYAKPDRIRHYFYTLRLQDEVILLSYDLGEILGLPSPCNPGAHVPTTRSRLGAFRGAASVGRHRCGPWPHMYYYFVRSSMLQDTSEYHLDSADDRVLV